MSWRPLPTWPWRWPWPREHRLRALGVGAGAALGLLLLTLVVYSWVALARFERVEERRATFVYAAAQPLVTGINVRRVDLAGTLARLKYHDSRGVPPVPGQFRRLPGGWEIHLRSGAGVPVLVEVRDDRITRVSRGGYDIGASALEPEVLTSADDRPGEDHRPVRLADVPLVLINAVLAAEDHRFFEHGGVDAHGLVRAAWANVRARRVLQGGSTITQQLVKNRLVGSRRTFLRKASEAWLATLVEWRYAKAQILEAYFNEIYLGQRNGRAIRGLGAAAGAYFRKEIHQLTPAEAALLAGMIRAPNSYSPVMNPERARARRDVVLARMHELGMLSPTDWQTARAAPVRVPPVTATGQPAPYFADYARAEIEQRFGDRGESAAVYTTLDLALQRFAEAAVVRGLDRLETRLPRLRRTDAWRRLQAALVAIDPTSGEIRALVGGREYATSQFNRAALARRQPGSAFKPFVYLAALRHRGDDPPALTAASFVDDVPVTVSVGNETWSPRNYEDRYEGRVTVRRALEHSLNAATVRVADSVGLPAVIETARELGFEGELSPVPAAALGVFEATPIELARAYLPLANGGVRPPGVVAVKAVRDRDGDVAPSDAGRPTSVITPAEAYLMTSLLEGVIQSGTAAAAHDVAPADAIAGKTGTTNDGRDAWFVGYTPRLVVAVWVGFDGGEAHGLAGADAALPIWVDFMRQAREAYPQPSFTVPGGITFADIDLTNGRLANRFCPLVGRETFLAGTEPPPCQEHGGVGSQIYDWWRRLRDWWQR
ncbi:MAG: PBP1A family penicillin-binding protein [Candidatus Rokuibacteriota bacterium]|nr:MAG: PBP1A family penicillin-binding protein [Candidatus Rokubacteria bacterium]